VNFDGDLFSNNNIVIPKIQVINSASSIRRKENKLIISNEIQNELFNLNNVVISEQQLKVSKKFYDTKRGQSYKESKDYHNNAINKWNNNLLNKINGSVTSKNRRNNKNYLIELEKYKEYIKYGLPAKEPIKPDFFPYPDFDAEFLKKLWDIQEGRDAYTNQPMMIDSKLKAFNPSGDRVSSKLPYKKGNMVLCCFSTNVCKYEFDIYDESENSWINYITNKDSLKKQEIYDRVNRIKELSLLI
jgi:hypothetical protein